MAVLHRALSLVPVAQLAHTAVGYTYWSILSRNGFVAWPVDLARFVTVFLFVWSYARALCLASLGAWVISLFVFCFCFFVCFFFALTLEFCFSHLLISPLLCRRVRLAEDTHSEREARHGANLHHLCALAGAVGDFPISVDYCLADILCFALAVRGGLLPPLFSFW